MYWQKERRCPTDPTSSYLYVYQVSRYQHNFMINYPDQKPDTGGMNKLIN